MIKTFNYYLFKLFNFLLLRLNINNKLSNFVKIQNGIQTIVLQESKYKFVNYLEEVECKIFSQNGEDGIINFLRKSMKIDARSMKTYGNYRKSFKICRRLMKIVEKIENRRQLDEN